MVSQGVLEINTCLLFRSDLQADAISQKPSSYIAASVFIALWLLLAYAAYFYLYRLNI